MTKPELDYDRYFSLYIRHRDCPDGRGYCITCGAPITPKTCDCGHYIGRAHKAPGGTRETVMLSARIATSASKVSYRSIVRC